MGRVAGQPKASRDDRGPRGFLRLEVPTGDYHKYYQAGPGRPAGRPVSPAPSLLAPPGPFA